MPGFDVRSVHVRFFGRSGTGTGLHLHVDLTRSTNGQGLGTLQKSVSFRTSEKIG
jgi:hypothetical protein